MAGDVMLAFTSRRSISRVFIAVICAAIGLMLGASAADPALGATAKPARPAVGLNSPATALPVVAYRATNNHVHVVTFPQVDGVDGPTTTTDLDVTSLSGGVGATGNPYGFARFATQPSGPPLQQDHVVYRSSNGHIHDIWRVETGSWTSSDLTALAGTSSRAVGDPVGWSDDTRNFQRVAFRGTDNHLHVLTWRKSSGLWVDIDVSRTLHLAATVLSSPTVAFDSRFEAFHPHVVYRGSNGHVMEVILSPETGFGSWRLVDLSIAARMTSVVAAGNPSLWGTGNVLLRTNLGATILMEESRTGAWTWTDLKAASHDPIKATGDPVAVKYIDELNGLLFRVSVRAADGNVHTFAINFGDPDETVDHPVWSVTSANHGALVTTASAANGGGGVSYTYTRLPSGHLTMSGYEDSTELEESLDLTTESGTSARVASLPRGYFDAR